MIDFVIQVRLFESMYFVCNSIKVFKIQSIFLYGTHLFAAIISETPFVLFFLLIYLSLRRIKSMVDFVIKVDLFKSMT